MTPLSRILKAVALAAFGCALGSANTIAYLSAPTSQSFSTDNTYSVSLPEFNTALGTLTGATIYFKVTEDLNSLSLTNSASGPETFDLEAASNIVFSSFNSANIADRYTGEALDLFDTGIGPGTAPQPSPEASITLGGSGTPVCPEADPSLSCSSVSYTPPDEVVSNTDAIYGFPAGTGMDGLAGVTKSITGVDLANYEGTSNFTLGGATKSLTTFSGGGNNIILNIQSTATVSAEVDYTYTASAATPEPATSSLMGGALLAIGLITRRLKKA